MSAPVKGLVCRIYWQKWDIMFIMFSSVCDHLKATLCRNWHFVIWCPPQFLRATPLS